MLSLPNLTQTIVALIIKGHYVDGWGSASGNWQTDIVANQTDAIPNIADMYPGTFNVRLIDPPEFVPNDIAAIRARKPGSCVSRTTQVTHINNHPLVAYIYNGGWPANTLELIAESNIAQQLHIVKGDEVILTLEVTEGLEP